MRDIKFRMYDVDNKEYVGKFHFGMNNLIIAYDEKRDILYEQYTGLKDKNGVEIYEGDIVLIHGFRKCLVKYLEVGYDSHPASVNGFGYVGINDTDDVWYELEWGLDVKDIEVIGNIHINPKEKRAI